MLANLSVSYADSSLYQREPCYSFGLKCWFATEQAQERKPILRFIWLAILHRFIDFQSTLPVFAERSYHPPLLKEGKFYYLFGLLFIAENKIKSFAYSISQSATADSSLYQREPCNSFSLNCWFTAKQFYKRQPVLRFVEVADLYRKNSSNNLKRGDQWSPLRVICNLPLSVAE